MPLAPGPLCIHRKEKSNNGGKAYVLRDGFKGRERSDSVPHPYSGASHGNGHSRSTSADDRPRDDILIWVSLSGGNSTRKQAGAPRKARDMRIAASGPSNV